MAAVFCGSQRASSRTASMRPCVSGAFTATSWTAAISTGDAGRGRAAFSAALRATSSLSVRMRSAMRPSTSALSIRRSDHRRRAQERVVPVR